MRGPLRWPSEREEFAGRSQGGKLKRGWGEKSLNNEKGGRVWIQSWGEGGKREEEGGAFRRKNCPMGREGFSEGT